MGLNIIGLFIGILFSIGLGVSGMTDPQKVLGFLDVKGTWDPTLLFVMGSAIPVYFFYYKIIMRRGKPIFDTKRFVPTRKDVDAKLIIGAGIFGIGWGVSGICPGPGIAGIGAMSIGAVVFVVAYLIGFSLESVFDDRIVNWLGRPKSK